MSEISFFALNTPHPEELGMLPIWAINRDYIDLPLKDALEIQYGFPLCEISGGTLTPDGAYRYPGEPPLEPLIRIDRGKERFYQYPHAIVALIDSTGKHFITRMD
jgi:hypothetical protein